MDLLIGFVRCSKPVSIKVIWLVSSIAREITILGSLIPRQEEWMKAQFWLHQQASRLLEVP